MSNISDFGAGTCLVYSGRCSDSGISQEVKLNCDSNTALIMGSDVDGGIITSSPSMFSAGYQTYSRWVSPTNNPYLKLTSPSQGCKTPLKKPKLEQLFPSPTEASALESSSGALNSSYKCAECGSVIKNISNLIVHQRRHLQYKPCHCAYCNYLGYDENDVERHISRMHPSSAIKVNFKPVPDKEQSVADLIASCKTLESYSVPSWNTTADVEQQPSAVTSREKSVSSMLHSLLNGAESISVRTEDCDADSVETTKKSDALVSCGLCSDTFVYSITAVIQHAKAHFESISYPCAFGCASTFASFDEFSAHIVDNHSSDVGSAVDDVLTSSSKFLPNQLVNLIDNYLTVAGTTYPLTIECKMCLQSVPWKRTELVSHCHEHQDYRPISCGYCSASFSSTTVAFQHQNEHSGVLALVLFKPDFREDLLRDQDLLFQKCFPDLSVHSIESMKAEQRGTDSKGSTAVIEPTAPELDQQITETTQELKTIGTKSSVSCHLCRASVSKTMSAVVAHTKVHLFYKPLKCGYCPFRHYSMTKVRQHNTRMHANKPLRVSYSPVPDIAQQVREMKQKCFGNISLPEGDNSIFKYIHEDEGQFGRSAMSTTSSEEQTTLSATSNTSQAVALQNMVFGSIRNKLTEQLRAASAFSGGRAAPPSASSAANASGDELSKKICMCCNVQIANNPSSFENHACKHLDYKPYHCQYCQYQSYIRGKVTRHIQQVHHGLPVKISHQPLPGIKEKILEMKLKCFPFLSSQESPNTSSTSDISQLIASSAVSGNEFFRSAIILPTTETPAKNDLSASEPSSFELRCQMCCIGLTVPKNCSNLTQIIDDHLQTHIVTKFYHCPICTYQTTYLIRAKQHVLSVHACKDARIILCPADGTAGLEALRRKCFGPFIESLLQTECDGDFNDTSHGDSLPVESCGNDGSLDSGDVGMNCGDSFYIDDSLNNNNVELIDEEGCEDGSQQEIQLSLQQHNNSTCCAMCHSYVLNERLAEHVRQHLDHKACQCPYCQWKASDAAEVKQHIQECHENASPKVLYLPERNELSRMQQLCFPTLAKSEQPVAGTVVNSAPAPNNNNNSSSMTGRKLVCHLCNQNIALNPKSVGIHVKNHLNYKPFRCPYCKYMSCEQSKARRHVEHVHSVSGDEIRCEIDDTIKEKITEMKHRCFPTLGHVGVNEVYGSAADLINSDVPSEIAASENDGSFLEADENNSAESSVVDDVNDSFDCQICRQRFPIESVDYHVRSHLGKALKCGYCPARFFSNDKAASTHVRSAHPGMPIQMVKLNGHVLSDAVAEAQFLALKQRCFPALCVDSEDCVPTSGAFGLNTAEHRKASIQSVSSFLHQDDEDDGDTQTVETGLSSLLSRRAIEPGKVICMLCDQSLASNNNSLDVHVKNHLNYKPHSCGWCDYRSCIVGKVKRHVENVHRGQESKIVSFNYTSSRMKDIFQELKAACFPQTSGLGTLATKPLPKAAVLTMLDEMRQRLNDELQSLALNKGLVDGYTVDVTNIVSVNAKDTDTSSEQINDDAGSVGSSELNVQDTVMSASPNVSKLCCALCAQTIAANPSSIGLHVRNHLDYKPFQCKLCDYRSCIQAKVKRHLRNVHKSSSDDMMTYCPVADIRQRVTEMKLKCFPRTAADIDLSVVGKEPETLLSGDAEAFRSFQLVDNSAINAYLDAVLGPMETDEHLQHVAAGSSNSFVLNSAAVCQMCGEEVANNDESKANHLMDHMGEFELKCQYCDFTTCVRSSATEHLVSEHSGLPPKVTKLPIKNKLEAFQRLSEACFPPSAEQAGADGCSQSDAINDPSYKGEMICYVCEEVIVNEATEITRHITQHSQMAHFKCGVCDFMNPQNFVVKEHLRSEHSNESNKIIYLPPDPKVDESFWRQKCFPEAEDIEELEELGEEVEDDSGQCSPSDLQLVDGVKSSLKDGPRYTCHLCKLPVSMYASSLYCHVKTHLDYKPYSCQYCSYKSPVKSKVRRHIQNSHKNAEIKIGYSPTPGIDHEVMRWKRLCFPEVTSFATLTNEKIPCQLCQTDVADTIISKTVHAKNHLNAKPYHCSYCSYRSCLRGEARRHVIRQHTGKPLAITFNESEVVDKRSVDEMIAVCFSTQDEKCSGSLAPMAVGSSSVRCLNQLDTFSVAYNSVVKSPGTIITTVNNEAVQQSAQIVKLGPAYREWYCCYCSFASSSKYLVKQHCLTEHPGCPVDVSDVAFNNKFVYA